MPRVLGVSAVLLFFGEGTPIDHGLEKITKKVSLNANDVRVTASISCALWTISMLIPHKPTQRFLQATSIIVPVCASLLTEIIIKKLNAIPIIKEGIAWCEFCSHFPILDLFFECTNKDCNSICTECKLRRSYQYMPLIAIIYAGVLRAQHYYKHHYAPLDAELRALITSKQTCSICLEEFQEQRIPVQLHQDQSSLVKHYICSHCFHDLLIQHRERNDIPVTTQIDGTIHVSYLLDPTPCSHCQPKCPLCNCKTLDPKNLLQERLEYALHYQKRYATR